MSESTVVVLIILHMSKNLSALKKTQVSLRNRSRNRRYKSTIKTCTKKYLSGLRKPNYSSTDTKDNEVFLNLSLVYQAIDKAVKRGVLHRNTGARKKSILARATRIRKVN